MRKIITFAPLELQNGHEQRNTPPLYGGGSGNARTLSVRRSTPKQRGYLLKFTEMKIKELRKQLKEAKALAELNALDCDELRNNICKAQLEKKCLAKKG